MLLCFLTFLRLIPPPLCTHQTAYDKTGARGLRTLVCGGVGTKWTVTEKEETASLPWGGSSVVKTGPFLGCPSSSSSSPDSYHNPGQVLGQSGPRHFPGSESSDTEFHSTICGTYRSRALLPLSLRAGIPGPQIRAPPVGGDVWRAQWRKLHRGRGLGPGTQAGFSSYGALDRLLGASHHRLSVSGANWSRHPGNSSYPPSEKDKHLRGSRGRGGHFLRWHYKEPHLYFPCFLPWGDLSLFPAPHCRYQDHPESLESCTFASPPVSPLFVTPRFRCAADNWMTSDFRDSLERLFSSYFLPLLLDLLILTWL